MTFTMQAALQNQFGAALDMLERALHACPESLWTKGDPEGAFWYGAYHTLFFVDYYLSDPTQAFHPPPPFDLRELDPEGLLPARTFTRDELLGYLDHGRQRLAAALAALTQERAASPAGFPRPELSVLELLLNTLRHVQHHTGQLNACLSRAGFEAPRWVSGSRD